MSRIRVPGATHFYVDEFDCHDGTPYPKQWIKSRLCPLVDVLEALRHELSVWAPAGSKVKIVVMSGFRTAAHNKKVKGAKYSQHLEGRAADIECYFKSQGGQWIEVHPSYVRQWARKIHSSGMRIGGIGYYPNGKNGSPGFTHIDVRSGNLARWSGE